MKDMPTPMDVAEALKVYTEKSSQADEMDGSNQDIDAESNDQSVQGVKDTNQSGGAHLDATRSSSRIRNGPSDFNSSELNEKVESK